jgi:hypothetical protein
MAGLSPAPSLEVEDVLHHAACRLLKMAHRCPESRAIRRSSAITLSTWTAEGYFAVLGELGQAFAYAQGHRGELRPVEDDSRVKRLFQQLGEELNPLAEKPSATPDAWPGDFDWLIRDVADFALFGLVPQIQAIHKAYAAARRDLDLESRIITNGEHRASLVVAASWLEAFDLVLETYERCLA